jgi:hypothetical protein
LNRNAYSPGNTLPELLELRDESDEDDPLDKRDEELEDELLLDELELEDELLLLGVPPVVSTPLTANHAGRTGALTG